MTSFQMEIAFQFDYSFLMHCESQKSALNSFKFLLFDCKFSEDQVHQNCAKKFMLNNIIYPGTHIDTSQCNA